MILLHIGLNKTGTSSIQVFCNHNRELLYKKGLAYPDVGIHDSAHYGVTKRLLGRPDAPHVPTADDLEQAVRAALSEGRRVLISSEYFFLAEDAAVAQIYKFFRAFSTECRVIIYLRRHDLWIASLFNQALKTSPKYSPWQSDIRDYILHLLGNREIETHYPIIIDRWARHFGAGAIIVRPFEKTQFYMGNFVWDFLYRIDPDLPEGLKQQGIVPKRVNESLPEHVIRAIDAVRSSDLEPEVSKRIIVQILQNGPRSEPVKNNWRRWDGRMFKLPPYLCKAVINHFSEDYRYIATKYMGSTDGILFREKI
jgi:hypothetical protein